VRDTAGDDVAAYFNIWRWIIKKKLTAQERGGRKGQVKPEAIIKFAHHPIGILAGEWERTRTAWEDEGTKPRPSVFIIHSGLQEYEHRKSVYEWLANDVKPVGIPTSRIEGFRNRDGTIYTIRVDSKVVHEAKHRRCEEWRITENVHKRAWRRLMPISSKRTLTLGEVPREVPPSQPALPIMGINRHSRRKADSSPRSEVNAKQGFRECQAARRTIQGYEAVHMIRKGQVRWVAGDNLIRQIQFIDSLFDLAT